MAIVNVTTANTFEEWRVKTNEVGTAVGNLTNLTETNTRGTDVIGALTDISTNLATAETTIAAIPATYVDVAGDTMTGDLDFNDDVKAKFGTGDDLQIYHNGTHSYIADSGTGQLKVITNGTGIDIQKDETETMAKFIVDGAVKLYHNNIEKFETTATGVDVTGNIVVSGTVDGRDMQTDGDKLDLIEASATADQTNAEIRAAVEAATDSNVFTDADHTLLNSITADFVNVSGDTMTGTLKLNDSVKAIYGTGNDLEIYHDGSNSYIKDVGDGDLIIQGQTNLKLQDGEGHDYLTATNDGAVSLFWDNASKLATTNTGVSVTGTITPSGAVIAGAGVYAPASGTLKLGVDSNNTIQINDADKIGIGKTPHSTYKVDITGTLNASLIKQAGVDVATTTYVDNAAESRQDDIGAMVSQVVNATDHGTSDAGTVYQILSVGSNPDTPTGTNWTAMGAPTGYAKNTVFTSANVAGVGPGKMTKAADDSTQTNISVQYDDDLNVLNFITPSLLSGSIDGNAATVTVNATTDTSCYVGLWEQNSGSLEGSTDAGLTYNATSNALTVAGDIEIGSTKSLIIGTASMSEGDLEKLDGITNGTAAANKAIVVDSNKDISGFRNVTSSGSFIIGSASMSETDLEKLDGITNGTAAANKAVVVNASKNITGLGTISSGAITSSGDITSGGSFIIGSASMSETDLEKLDGITNGTVTASKAVVVNASKNITGLGTISSGAITSSGIVTANAGVKVDNITIDGTEIDLSSGDLTIDVDGDIILDANGGEIVFKDDGTQIGYFSNGSSDFIMHSSVNDKDIIFKGVDNNNSITALTLDMSEAGKATFNSDVVVGGDLTINGTTTSVNSTTLTVDDKNIELGTVDTPTDTTADGGGITLKGATDKTILWTNSTDSWDFNQAVKSTNGFIGDLTGNADSADEITRAVTHSTLGSGTAWHSTNGGSNPHSQSGIAVGSSRSVIKLWGNYATIEADNAGSKKIFQIGHDVLKYNGVTIVDNNQKIPSGILPEATTTAKGAIELFSNTDQSVAANAVSTAASRTYGLQLNSAGQGVVNVPWTDNNTNQLTSFVLEDGDGTEVTISHGKEVKFVEATNGGINIDWTDTSTGSDGDPYDLSFSIKSDGVTAAHIGDNVINSEHYAADSIDEEHIANDAVSKDQLKSLVTLVIYNSSGTAVKTLYGAGA